MISPPFTFVCVALALTLAGRGLHAADTNPARIGPMTTLTFDASKSALTSESREKLDAMVASARVQGKIDEVQVAVWSDNPAPRDKEALSKPDRMLAAKRLTSVHNY